MISIYRQIWKLLSLHERRQALLLLVMIIIMGFLQMIGVASIIPFMTVVGNPDAVESNPYLAVPYKFFDFSDTARFLYLLGIINFIALIISVLFRAITTYAVVRFSQLRYYSLSRKLMECYLGQPFDWFLQRHSADLGKAVLSETEQVVRGAISPGMHAIAEGVIVVSLVALLIVVDPVLAIGVTIGLGGVYALIYMALRGYLSRLGSERLLANRQRYEAVQETFGSIKDVKVGGLEGTFLQRFDGPAKRSAERQATQAVAEQMPRFALEALAFGGLLIVVIYLMQKPGGLENALPILAVYAFSAYRLMPTLQSFYGRLVTLRFSGPAVAAIHQELAMLQVDLDANLPVKRASPMGLAHYIRLKGVTYSYPGNDRPSLKDVSLSISAYSTIGIVGRSGSGKTTLVDVILGLLRPQRGEIGVDGELIKAANIRAWQSSIGYVAQHIYLADDTVTANIAFGVSPNEVDHAAVERAARIANLHSFVAEELSNGYDTLVGERGVRLSGGQRQRIGIARALYHDPDLLILDEATSALDNLTEQAVMEAVGNIGTLKTVIIIAHRLSTVRECTKIFMLENGQIVGEGRFDKLVELNTSFRALSATTLT